MAKKLCVGNLSFEATEDQLRQAFGQYGTVNSAQVVTDRDTGRSRGFALVEMADGADDAGELDKLSADERKECLSLWVDVDTVLSRSQK